MIWPLKGTRANESSGTLEIIKRARYNEPMRRIAKISLSLVRLWIVIFIIVLYIVDMRDAGLRTTADVWQAVRLISAGLSAREAPVGPPAPHGPTLWDLAHYHRDSFLSSHSRRGPFERSLSTASVTNVERVSAIQRKNKTDLATLLSHIHSD